MSPGVNLVLDLIERLRWLIYSFLEITGIVKDNIQGKFLANMGI